MGSVADPERAHGPSTEPIGPGLPGGTLARPRQVLADLQSRLHILAIPCPFRTFCPSQILAKPNSGLESPNII